MKSFENLPKDYSAGDVWFPEKNKLLCILLLGCRQFEALCKLNRIVYTLCALLKSGECHLELEYGRVLRFC